MTGRDFSPTSVNVHSTLEEGQRIFHVGWVSQVENKVGTEGCN